MQKLLLLLITLFFLLEGNTEALPNPMVVKNSYNISYNLFSAAEEIDDYLTVYMVLDKELIVVQWKNLNTVDMEIVLTDASEKVIHKAILYKGSTIAYFETQTLYKGDYFVKISDGKNWLRKKISLIK